MATEEGWHTTDDGKKLYTKTWKTEGPAKARVVFIHGFSDHCNNYDNLFPALAAKGIEVYTFDQRGWGRSVQKPAEKGHTGTTARVLNDITSFIKTVIPSPVPLFMMGHSMGGGETLCYAAQGPAEVRKHIRGFLLESPFVDFDPKSKPSFVTVALGRLVGKLLPHRQMVNKLDVKLISRDPAVQKKYEEDDLCHDTGTLEGLAGLLDRTADLAAGKIKIGDDAGEGGVTRIWFGHGDKDGITDFAASKRLFDALTAKDKEFKAYGGFYHRLHDEPSPENQQFIDDVVNWILSRSVEPVQADAGKAKL
ncbi:alpha/beta-hydrolase [Aaosphaeria arxii CBS 175.79]|uniref:Alpha/beta-hydrolase n=1 Tax=Aaosphaeria arxii CBS 175.79 TaxID=1450172 RepID=A0A6A5YA61_9PLEO|nr:alpha/beta-hydrolase [Aaosphaeria arxii CBS 175.79]KAF2021641.1 alpha/beta-hydrolase [Aaosphaeria arxii CBS 175.79]